jgi:hypothetical protein
MSQRRADPQGPPDAAAAGAPVPTDPTRLPGLVPVPVAAAVLGRPAQEVYRGIRAGKIRADLVGERSLRIPAAEVQRLLGWGTHPHDPSGRSEDAAAGNPWIAQAARLTREIRALRREARGDLRHARESLDRLEQRLEALDALADGAPQDPRGHLGHAGAGAGSTDPGHPEPEEAGR